MGLISRYELNGTTANLGNDSQGSRDMTNTNAVSVVDTYGNCGYFDGSAKMSLNKNLVHANMKYANIRSYSCWFKGVGSIHSNGGADSSLHRYKAKVTGGGILSLDFQNATNIGTTVLDLTVWHHYASIYDGTTSKTYVDGNFEGASNRTLNTVIGHFGIGWDETNSNQYFTGFLSDFRYFNTVLSDSNVLSVYSAGPNGAFIPSIASTLYTHVGALSWTTTLGASTHTVSQVKDGASEEVIVSDSAELSFTPTGITPGSSYVFNLYTDLDLVTPIASVSTSAPIVSSSSVAEMAAYLENDFSSLSEEAFDAIETLLFAIYSTGDKVTLPSGINIYIENADSIRVHPWNSYLTPFEQSEVSGQNVTVINADGSGTNVVEYDESTNEVLVGSTSYPVNASFVLGNYRVTIKEV